MARDYKLLTEEEKVFLKENYLLLSDARLASLFSRTETNIRKLRQLLGLKRRGANLKEVVATIPVVIWLPRKYFEENDLQTTTKIKGKK